MLGGKYSTALRPTSTHLVIDKAVGAKYDSCARLNVVPVTIAWLWDVARQGALCGGLALRSSLYNALHVTVTANLP